MLARLEAQATGAVKTAASAAARGGRAGASAVARNAKPAATAVAQGATKNAAMSAGMEATKEGVVSIGSGENHMDPTKIAAQGAFGALISPIGQKVAETAPLSRVISNESAQSGVEKFVVAPSVNASINATQQAVHEAISPNTADDVAGTSLLDAAKAAPSAIGNLPDAVADAALHGTTQSTVAPGPVSTIENLHGTRDES